MTDDGCRIGLNIYPSTPSDICFPASGIRLQVSYFLQKLSYFIIIVPIILPISFTYCKSSASWAVVK